MKILIPLYSPLLQSPLRAFDLLGNVILSEVDAGLAAQLPGVVG
jgi:hypothetical protein